MSPTIREGGQSEGQSRLASYSEVVAEDGSRGRPAAAEAQTVTQWCHGGRVDLHWPHFNSVDRLKRLSA
jgi:hypothetical protein